MRATGQSVPGVRFEHPALSSMATTPTVNSSATSLGMPRTSSRPTLRAVPELRSDRCNPTSSILTISPTTPYTSPSSNKSVGAVPAEFVAAHQHDVPPTQASTPPLVNTLASAVIGLAVGALVVAIMHLAPADTTSGADTDARRSSPD